VIFIFDLFERKIGTLLPQDMAY